MIQLPFLPSRVTLRLKFIIALVGMSVIPLIIALSITIWRVQITQREDVYNVEQQVAQTAAEEVKAFITSQFKVLEDIGNITPEFNDPAIRDTVVEKILFKNDNFVELSLVDTSGQELSRKNILRVIEPTELQNLASSEEFKIVKQSGYYIGPTFLSNGKPYFVIGQQILDVNRNFQGAAFATVDARVMQDVVKNISAVGAKGRVFIVDKGGKVIAHPDISVVLAEKNFANFLVVNNLIHDVNTYNGIYQNELNQQVLGSGVPIKILFDSRDKQTLDTNWFVVAEQPISIAFASVYQITQFNLAVLAIILIGAIIGTLVFGAKIVGPIEKLYLAAKKLGEGDLNYRINLKTGDELEDLAQGFNSMAIKLQENITQLTHQNKLVSALQKIDQISLSSKQVKQVCQEVVELISTGLGYAYGGIVLIDPQAKVLRRVAKSARLDSASESLSGEQIIPLSVADNLLVTATAQKQSFYTERLFDIQKGLFQEQYSDQFQAQLNIKAIFVYPLILQDRVLGAIYYISSLPKNQILDIEYKILQGFTNEAARAIESTGLYENLANDRELMAGERNKLAVTLSGITDAVIAVDLEGKIVIFNAAAESLTGYSRDDVLGRFVDQIIRIFDDGKEIGFQEYCPSKDDSFDGIVFNKQELQVISAKESFVNLVVGQIKNRSRINLAGILTLHDLSREKQLEEMKLDFVSMAAHELRTPLTSIKGYLYIYLRNYRQSLNTEQLTFLTRMSIASQRLGALVENLLNVTRIEKGAMTIHIEAVDWIENAKQLVTELTDQAKDKKITVEFIAPQDDYPKVGVDKFRVNEVLSNLVSNAINYTKVNGQIKIWFEKNDKEVITHVEDNGPGIPKEALPHLFTKFFRVSGKLEQGSKGTGLGLFISKSIIDMHKGRIWVESELDKGSVFSFALPIYSEES